MKTTSLLLAAASGLLAPQSDAATIFDDTTSDLSSTTTPSALQAADFTGVSGLLATSDTRDDVVFQGLLGGSLLQVTTFWSTAATDARFQLSIQDAAGTVLSTIGPAFTGNDTRSVTVPGDGQLRFVATPPGIERGTLSYSYSFPAPVPEPGSAALAAAGALTALMARRRRGQP